VYQKSGKMDKIPGRPAYPRPAGLAPQHTMPRNFARVIMSTNPSQSNLVPSKIHKQRPKGLSNGRLGPLSVSKCSFKTQTALSKNVQPLIDASVKRRAERSQTQAGRPKGGRPAYQSHALDLILFHRPPGDNPSHPQKVGGQMVGSLGQPS